MDENNVISVAERLYKEANPTTKMDVPSYAYEVVEKEMLEWLMAKSEITLYQWCKERTKK